MALKVIKNPRFRQGATELVVALGQSEEVSRLLPAQAAVAATVAFVSTKGGDHG